MKYGSTVQYKRIPDGCIFTVFAIAHTPVYFWSTLIYLDQRNPPPLGRIPDTADIIGTVLVNEGKLVPDTYAPMPSYRMVTSDGVMSLTDSILRKLKTALIKVAEEERNQ